MTDLDPKIPPQATELHDQKNISLFDDLMYSIGNWYPSTDSILKSNDPDFLKASLTFSPDLDRTAEIPMEEIGSMTSHIHRAAFARLSQLVEDGFTAELDNNANNELAPTAITSNNEKASLGREALDVLIEAVPVKGTSSQRSDLCLLLKGHPEYSDQVLTMLEDPYSKVRITAGLVLGGMINNKGDDPNQFQKELETKIVEFSSALDLSKHPERAEAVCYALKGSSSKAALDAVTFIAENTHSGTAEYVAAKIAKSMQKPGIIAA